MTHPPAAKRLLFATQNAGKLRELRELVAALDVEVLSLADITAPEVEETGETFAENAILKAQGACEATGLPTLADDSGLEVDALDGRPGVRSARYAGPDANDRQRYEKLLGELEPLQGQNKRTARFRCAMAFCLPGAKPVVHQGACEGEIMHTPRGEGGFGYDPVFFCHALQKSFAEADAAEKNRVSHRGKALELMADVLRDYFRQA
ncbi:MAG: XTP/dITP diphosphatase [Deltaproteobacteria bacterium]|nr:XTP/dITP diphosphatase [Deltaproteobacteria bacterium]